MRANGGKPRWYAAGRAGAGGAAGGRGGRGNGGGARPRGQRRAAPYAELHRLGSVEVDGADPGVAVQLVQRLGVGLPAVARAEGARGQEQEWLVGEFDQEARAAARQ